MGTQVLADDVIVACAHDLSARLDGVATDLIEQLGRSVPEFLEDPDLARESIASARGNVDAMLSVFRGETSAAEVRLPPEVLAFASGMARRRMPLERLVQSYRVGQTLFSRLWLDTLAARVSDQVVFIETLHRSFDALNVYLDRVVTLVVAEYEYERERWVRGAVARRGELVARLLRGERLPSDVTSRQLGHDLRAPQTGLIAWAPSRGDVEGQLAQLETCMTQLARDAGIPRLLMLPTGTSSLWAWIAGDVDHRRLAAAASDLPHPEVLLVAGSTVTGVDAFRVTHEQAVRGQRVAALMPDAPRLTRYDRVATVALLAGDEAEARQFVARALGALAARNAATERLRETLWVFLEEGRNTRRASERLFTHRNTVLYRLQRAEVVLGHPLDEHRLDVEMALLLTTTLGDRMLPE